MINDFILLVYSVVTIDFERLMSSVYGVISKLNGK